jgi:Tol biopolymer transport system component
MSGIKPACSLAGLTLAALLVLACDNRGTQSLYDVIAPPDTIVAGLSDFNREIYTIAPDGGHLTRITDTPTHAETDPVWAVDGRLAFVRRPLFESEDELIITSGDGTEPVPVAGGMDISQPAWSPDGSRTAFVEGAIRFYDVGRSECTRIDSSLGQTPPRLFVADVPSRTTLPLIDLVSPDGCILPFARPEWSPDGSKIALAQRGVYLLDVATGRLTETVPPSDVIAVAWSPDGERLAVAAALSPESASARVLVVTADGQDLVEIARLSKRIHSLAWSPRGDLVSIVADDAYGGQGSLSVIRPDGGDLGVLAKGVLGGVAWSPDGRRLAVALGEPSFEPYAANIYAVDVDDGGITRLTNVDATEYSPTWSPDGSAIAFVSNRDAQSGVFAVHPDGSFTPLIPTHSEPPQTFLGPDRRVSAPAEASVQTEYWVDPLIEGVLSPDGRRLANLVSTAQMQSEGCGGDAQDIYTRNADGSEVINVTNTPDINEIEVAWSPDSRRLALTSGVPPRCHFIPSRLEVMNADGNERRLLADFTSSEGQVDTPRWIADGGALLFHVTHLGPGQQFGTPAGNPELYTVNVDGSDLRRVFEPARTDFQWLLSPDGERLAILDARAPAGWRMLLGNVDGTGMKEVASGDGELSQVRWWPGSWSPDSTRLAFSECRGDPCQAALLVVNTDGSGVRTLIDPYTAFEPPAWFPDGSRLAFITHPDPCSGGEGPPPGHLEVIDVEGGESERITDRCVVRWILGWPQQ